MTMVYKYIFASPVDKGNQNADIGDLLETNEAVKHTIENSDFNDILFVGDIKASYLLTIILPDTNFVRRKFVFFQICELTLIQIVISWSISNIQEDYTNTQYLY